VTTTPTDELISGVLVSPGVPLAIERLDIDEPATSIAREQNL
jgi:hypothetical protein